MPAVGREVICEDLFRVFIDTEFTGLGQRCPHLISIGLISEDGQHTFYAELTPESYMEKVTPWVQDNVLPLLESGDHVLQPDTLRKQLADWLTSLGEVVIATDEPEYDIAFLRALLERWPTNVAKEPLRLNMNYLHDFDAFEATMDAAYASGLRRHHALDDAKANRFGWIAAGGDTGRAVP